MKSPFSWLFFLSALPPPPAHPLGRTPQEGRRRQWLLGCYHGELRWVRFSVSDLSLIPHLCTAGGLHCNTGLLWSLVWAIFHRAPLSFTQLCSQLSLPHSAGQLSSWCCLRVRKGTNIIWEIVLVLVGLGLLWEHKKSHLYQVQSQWLHVNLIVRAGVVGTQHVSVPRPGEGDQCGSPEKS